MKAAFMLNEQEGYRFEMYGIVSSGKIWEFGQYTPENHFYRSDAYTIAQLESILGILAEIFTACDRHHLN